jgi:hypothetical protein
MTTKNDLIDILTETAFSEEFYKSWKERSKSNSNYVDDRVQQKLQDIVEQAVDDAGVSQVSPQANEIELSIFSDKKLIETLEDKYYKLEFEFIEERVHDELYKQLEVGPKGVKLFRCVSVMDGKTFAETLKRSKYVESFAGVGIYWSFSYGAAECHWGHRQQGEQVTLIGYADINSIDLEGTAIALTDISLGLEELEIRLKEGAPVYVEKVEAAREVFDVDKVLQAGKQMIGARGIYYHGTSSGFLNRIKAEGLNPDPGHKVYEKGHGQDTLKNRSLETFGGVYLTTDPYTAVNSAFNSCIRWGGDPLFIFVQMSSTSRDLLIDEDEIITMLTRASGYQDWSDVEGDLTTKLDSKDPNNTRKGIETELNSRNFPHAVDEFKLQIEGLIEETVTEDVDAGKILKNYDKVKPFVADAIRKLALHLVDTEYRGDPDYLYYDKGFNEFRNSITLLSKKLKALTTLDRGGEKSVRYTKPITFKGQNKIVGIVLADTDWDYDETLEQYVIDSFNLEILYNKNKDLKHLLPTLQEYIDEQGHGGTYYRPDFRDYVFD